MKQFPDFDIQPVSKSEQELARMQSEALSRLNTTVHNASDWACVCGKSREWHLKNIQSEYSEGGQVSEQLPPGQCPNFQNALEDVRRGRYDGYPRTEMIMKDIAAYVIQERRQAIRETLEREEIKGLVEFIRAQHTKGFGLGWATKVLEEFDKLKQEVENGKD